MSSFHLDIFTPYGTYFSGEAEYLRVRTPDSVLGILPKHTPIIASVALSQLMVIINGNKHYYSTTGGLVNVKKDGKVVLMVSTIESQQDIDLTRAQEAKKRAEKHLSGTGSDIVRAKNALARANNRIKVKTDPEL